MVFTANVGRKRAISGIMPSSILLGVLLREEYYRDQCDPTYLKLRRKQLREDKRKVQFQTLDKICILHHAPSQPLVIRVGVLPHFQVFSFVGQHKGKVGADEALITHLPNVDRCYVRPFFKCQ